MANSEYSKACEGLKSKIQASARPGKKPSCAFSKGDLDSVTHALLNSPDYTYQEYNMKVDEKGKPIVAERNPSRRYRDSLKPTLKALGLDKGDVDKIDTMQFGREHASALVNLASVAIKDTLLAGRKYQLPMTGANEARMEIYVDTCPERVSTNDIAARRFTKDGAAPAGAPKTTKTEEHVVLKAKKKVPSWLKKSVD